MKSTMFMLAGAVCAYLLLPPPYVSGEPPTPNVNVVNVPGVEVVNETPIAVTPNVKERFMASGGHGFAVELLTVPEGKRAVVEHIGGFHNVGGTVHRSRCKFASSAYPQLYFLVQEPNVGSDERFFSMPITYFADAGETITVVCTAAFSNFAYVDVTLVGYYEDM